MTRICFYQPGEVEDALIRFVVVAARYEGQWVFSRHKLRSSWDMPGGHREAGETLLEAVKRELWEETGAKEAELRSVCVYSVEKQNQLSYGMLYFSQIDTMEALPTEFEMAEICFSHTLPKNLTYPDIQPELFSYIQGWLNQQSNAGELWDVYDEQRNKTGQLHRRGDPLAPGQYHLVVHVWIRNREGKYLLTKRSPNKGFPNMWESTGGSALAGDDSLTAALREVREETGLVLDPEKGRCVISGKKMDFFRDVWLFHQEFDLNDVILQPGETVDKMFADVEEIQKLRRGDLFVPYDYLDTLFSMI